MEGLFEEVTLPRRKGDRTCENLGKAHQDWVSAGGSCWFLPFRLLCCWDNKHSAQHRGDWLDQPTYPGLDGRPEKERLGDDAWNFTGVWRVVWMDVNFLVFMTVPWLWKMLTFRRTG